MEGIEKGIIVDPQVEHVGKIMRVKERGMEIMRNSKDILHAEDHVLELAEYRKQFQIDSPKEAANLDPEVMDLSETYHDSWKATQTPSNNLLRIFHAEVWEGMGSMFIFSKNAREEGLNESLIKRVQYAIRKHSSFNPIPKTTLEAKALFDFDNLSMWEPSRFLMGVSKFLGKEKEQIRSALKIIHKYGKMELHLDWSNKKLAVLKPKLIEKLEDLLHKGKK